MNVGLDEDDRPPQLARRFRCRHRRIRQDQQRQLRDLSSVVPKVSSRASGLDATIAVHEPHHVVVAAGLDVVGRLRARAESGRCWALMRHDEPH